MSNAAAVKKEVLKWARERAGLDAEGAAKGITTPDKWEAWERGQSSPTFKQALGLAKKLHVPFGYLFLSSPPKEALPLPDLRTLHDRPPDSFTVDLIDVLYDALRKQLWYREYQKEEGEAPLLFVGSQHSSGDARAIAWQIRDALGVNSTLRQSARDTDGFFQVLAQRSEDLGILVMRTGVVGANTHRRLDPSEFQGFAMADPLAPLVFVNGKDWKAAQVFTLAHELAHIWVGKSGISKLDYRVRSDGQANPTEKMCDRVAAELLMPSRDIMAGDWGDIEGALRQFRLNYKVSEFVVLRQAYENDVIDRDEYREHYGRLRANVKERPDRESGGGNSYFNLLARNSRRFTWTLLAATGQGRVSAQDASRLLNVPVRSVDEAYKRMVGQDTSNA